MKHYCNDFDASILEAQLELLGVMFSSTTEKLNPTLVDQVSTLSPLQRTSLSEICTLLKLIYVTQAALDSRALAQEAPSAIMEAVVIGLGAPHGYGHGLSTPAAIGFHC